MDGDVNKVVAHDRDTTVQRIRSQVDRLSDWCETHLKGCIAQYDRIIERSDTHPEAALRALECKTRAVASLAEMSRRIAAGARDLESGAAKLMTATARNKSATAQLAKLARSARRGVTAEMPPSEIPRPKVRMFKVGCDFRATVGLGLINREAPVAEPP